MDDLSSEHGLRGRSLSRDDIQQLCPSTRLHLLDCDLEEVYLSRLDLSCWRFERCNLRHADLSGAVLEGVAWQGCRGAFANFTGATLAESSFHASDFNNAAFRRAKLYGARFSGCKLTGADFTDASAMEIGIEETQIGRAHV